MARLDELERKFEENPRRYFAPLANEYRKAGDAERAAELCRSQLPDVPGHISGHIVLGQALFDSGDFGGSRSALETALALDPENIVALRYLGDIARSTGDTVEAERWYSRTLEADPYNEAATLALQALRESADTSEAREEPAPERDVDVVAEAESTTTTSAPAEGFEPTSYEPLPEAAEAANDAVDVSAQPFDAIEAPSGPPEALVADVPGETEPVPSDEGAGSVEFTGDLEISAPSEPVGQLEAAGASEASEFSEGGAAEPEVQATEAAATDPVVNEAVAAERFDVAAHASAELAPVEESIQAEEREMESAAPFVTETMADLYMEQGYPHEALELLLQLAEQRPQDAQLRVKIEHIESVILERRNAAVAAARAERAEMSAAADHGGDVVAESPAPDEPTEPEEHAEPAEPVEPAEPAAPVESPEPAAAPFDPAVAEIDSSAFAEVRRSDTPISFGIPPLEVASDPPISVRELFARMDRVRPRPASTVTPRPLSRLRSDFVAMPESGAQSASTDDPFAFPDAEPRAEEPPGAARRSSGPQPTFNPSTADSDDFNAWLRGLKGQ